ncbi:hypothetical protein D3Y59_07960 [Hymenobacter oligotrophus]|uniref:Heavy metal binding domain-containing protein n=1 Tax=Hymenobacter oligotrophus TaxID=2319843 RepID=A0A3B7QZF3_9BACT|nr:heavy metal-binding domain-containing protein [Hymenobacter oligotrophus]AYA36995.1 hypothetical protein D3Y59_07960 [Hymenobacter oligotrophus]
MKRILFPVLALASLTWAASCSSNDSAASQPAVAAAAEHHNHEPAQAAAAIANAAYVCPMHPEVTSPNPGKCPKCGMDLQPSPQPAATTGPDYRMDFRATPAQLAAGQPATLSFQPQAAADPKATVPLAVVHEKKMHLIVVSKDLAEFYHEHPNLQASGRYEVPFTFKTGGEYVLFQDYQPVGKAHQLSRQVVTVAGAPKKPVQFAQDQLRWTNDGYTAALSFDKRVQAGQPLVVAANLSRQGQPITDLANYLGAKGHMVIIGADTEQYLHVHPQHGNGSGPKVSFQTTFDKPGLYRVFLQFNHAGKVRTADFTVNVAPATS